MKTRRSLNPPSAQQIIRDRMQGMIYWYGLNSMINGEIEMGDFWSAYRVDLIENDFNELILSEEYMESLEIPENEWEKHGTLLSVGNLIKETLKNTLDYPDYLKPLKLFILIKKALQKRI